MINSSFLILIYIGLAKLFWNIVLIFLPFHIDETAIKHNFKFNRRVSFSEKFMNSAPIQSTHKSSFNNKDLKRIKLKVIFKKGSKSFILIEDNGKKTYINLRKNYKGYQLVEIRSNFVVFERNKKLYKIKVKKEKGK